AARMTERSDEDGQLTHLLRILPAPEPSAQFAAAARRRYLAAIEARARREALTGLVAALVGLAAVAVSVATVTEPAGLVAWLAEAAADLARWTAGIGVGVALGPPAAWGPGGPGSAAVGLSLEPLARAPAVPPPRATRRPPNKPGARSYSRTKGERT